MQTISAAGRLLAILKKAAAQAEGMSVNGIWAETLGLDPLEPAAIYRAMGSIFDLIAESKKETAAHAELNQELYQNALKTVEIAVVNINAQPHWS